MGETSVKKKAPRLGIQTPGQFSVCEWFQTRWPRTSGYSTPKACVYTVCREIVDIEMLSMRAGLVSCSVSWLHVSDLVTGRGQNLPICKTHFGSNFWEVSKMSASTGNYFLPVIRSCRTGCNTDITYWKNSLKCMCLSPRTDDG